MDEHKVNKILATVQKSSRVTVSLTEKDHQRLTQIAAHLDISISWVIRQSISEYLDRNRPEEPELPLTKPTHAGTIR